MTNNMLLKPYRHRSPPQQWTPTWMRTELVNVEQNAAGNIASTLWPYAIMEGETGVLDQRFPIGDVRRYGAIGDGTLANAPADLTAFANATTSAIAGLWGYIYVPPGYRFRLTSPVTATTGVTYFGITFPAGGVADTVSPTSSTILKDFAGDPFIFNGADGVLPGSGGGLRWLRIVNINGSGVTANGNGYAANITGIDPSHMAHWVVLDGVICENSLTSDSWTGLAHIDGLTPGAVSSDHDIRNCSAHIACANGHAVLSEFGSASLTNCKFYQAGANVTLTGAAGQLSSAWDITGCNIAGTVALDWASGINLTGGIVTAITDTVNTSGVNVFRPGQITTPFTSLSGTCAAEYSDGTQWITNVPWVVIP